MDTPSDVDVYLQPIFSWSGKRLNVILYFDARKLSLSYAFVYIFWVNIWRISITADYLKLQAEKKEVWAGERGRELYLSV